MKTILKYEFLLWIFLSVSLFVFILPIDADILVKIIAGYVFYLFVKEVIYNYFRQIEKSDSRIDALKKRIGRLPHKTSVYIHDDSIEDKKEDRKKEHDARRFM